MTKQEKDQKREQRRSEFETKLSMTLINTFDGKKPLLDLIRSGVKEKVEFHAKIEKPTGGVEKPFTVVDEIIDLGLRFNDGFEICHVEKSVFNYVVAPKVLVYKRK